MGVKDRKKWVLSALFMALVIMPTASVVSVVKAEVYLDDDEGIQWETIYQADGEQTNACDSSNPDLSVWTIKLGWLPIKGWRIKWWLYNTKFFLVPIFYDGVYISDDSSNPYKYLVRNYPHIAEPMWAGINGVYKTQYFHFKHAGRWWITVYTDVKDDVEEENEYNNVETAYKYIPIP